MDKIDFLDMLKDHDWFYQQRSFGNPRAYREGAESEEAILYALNDYERQTGQDDFRKLYEEFNPFSERNRQLDLFDDDL